MTPRDKARAQNSHILGVTGPSGAGKSEVCRLLEAEGFAVIDVDKLAKTLYKKGNPGFKRLQRLFGKGIVGTRGQIDRQKLGALVFSSKSARQKLNKALFPLIYKAVQEKIVLKQRLGKRKVCLDMAVLYQAGAQKLCDEVLLVDDQVGRREKRLMKRGMDPVRAAGQARALSFSDRQRQRSIVLRNRGSRMDLQRRVRKVLRTLSIQ